MQPTWEVVAGDLTVNGTPSCVRVFFYPGALPKPGGGCKYFVIFTLFGEFPM